MILDDRPPPYETIAFDCDSTLSAIEGIDELARAHGVDVSELTERAMQGEISLESVYARRLAMIRPTRAALERVGELYVARALPHARDLCSALRSLEKRVCIVSGGLEIAVSALARALGFDPRDVYAVRTVHAPDGAYEGFDERSPLARSGGKIELAARLAREGAPLAFVGDGITDLETAPHAARFVAFAGVARRSAVLERARVACEHADLAALLPLLASEAEVARLEADPAHAKLVRAARAFAP